MSGYQPIFEITPTATMAAAPKAVAKAKASFRQRASDLVTEYSPEDAAVIDADALDQLIEASDFKPKAKVQGDLEFLEAVGGVVKDLLLNQPIERYQANTPIAAQRIQAKAAEILAADAPLPTVEFSYPPDRPLVALTVVTFG